ncbi:hypothetical protein LguiA_024137 [Lonicera macranthoides]
MKNKGLSSVDFDSYLIKRKNSTQEIMNLGTYFLYYKTTPLEDHPPDWKPSRIIFLFDQGGGPSFFSYWGKTIVKGFIL